MLNCPSFRTPICIIVLNALCATGVRADEFELTLAVQVGDRHLTTDFTDELPTVGEPHARPVFAAAKGETLLVSWQASNNGSEMLPDVLVHFFVVKEEKTGQRAVPRLDQSVPHEGALTLDFKPARSARGQFSLHITEPGSYLVRVESQGLAAQRDHECFTALDLVVKK